MEKRGHELEREKVRVHGNIWREEKGRNHVTIILVKKTVFMSIKKQGKKGRSPTIMQFNGKALA